MKLSGLAFRPLLTGGYSNRGAHTQIPGTEVEDQEKAESSREIRKRVKKARESPTKAF
jgi:hypothetical protein